MEAPWPFTLVQKDTQKDIKLQKTPIDVAEHGEGEADAQGAGDRRTRCKPFGTGRGLGCQSKPAGIGNRRAGDGDRKREEGTLGRDNPW